MVNISQIVQYKKQVRGQKVEEVKPVEVERVKEQEIKKILNKKKVRGVIKYLVWWKEFMEEHNSWKKEKDLENTKVVAEFERRISTEVRK